MARAPSGTFIAAGVCLAQIGEFSFVLGGIARNEGLLSDETLDLFVAASVITLLLVPGMVALAPRIAGRRWEHMVSAGSSEGGHAVVIGIGPSAAPSLRSLADAGVPVTVIDFNSEAVMAHVQAGSGGVVGDARRPEILRAADVRMASMVIVSLPDPLAVAAVVEQVRLLAADVQIVVRCSYNRAQPRLVRAGADTVVLEEDAVGQVLGAVVEEQIGARSS